MKNILVDETIFIFSTRADHQLFTDLIRFVKLSEPSNPKQKFKLYMEANSRKRLGIDGYFDFFSFYRVSRWRRHSRYDWYTKRNRRVKAAIKSTSRSFYVPTHIKELIYSFIPFHKKRVIMDLFLFANEEKSSMYNKEGRNMSPSDVIPLEMCEVAYVAFKKKIPLFSFNTDYKYFCSIKDRSHSFIEYLSLIPFCQT